ncbi:MAG TPA: thiamine pyrophosphate-dependent dehydrogenase E1 component subunit alpha [Planctomycetota bacterium]|nr:thiamine pyrophosphate-dependent dehydrogenase E1 component subunit alpha [Planctomycetota bacterium]
MSPKMAKGKSTKPAAAARTRARASAPVPGKRTGRAPPEPASKHLVRVLELDGTVKGKDPSLAHNRLLFLYEQMVTVREFDRRMLMLQRQGRIGFYGPILGQEAATVGSVAALEPRDWIFPALREGAAAMMRGLSLTEAMNQLIGNSADRCKGRQMPCHYTFKEGHYYGMSSVIGTQVSHAVGAAMAARIRGDDVVVLGYLGDGATSANDFHCGMNFAAVYKSPCVLFCQNNQWAISVPIGKQSASATLAQKGEAYGMPFERVDGNDVLAVYAVTKAAVERARAGEGPTFIEAVTYRRLGHSSSDDPTKYRDEAEVKLWEKRDPVDRFRKYLGTRELWDEAKEAALKQRIALAVNEAIAAAEKNGPPADETLVTDVFAHVTPQLREQLGEVMALEGRAVNEGAFPL